MDIKLTISDSKTGKSYKRELKGQDSKVLIGKKIGDIVKGDNMGFSGYEFQVTGGSDDCGFPMRRDVEGITKRKIYTVKSKGIRIAEKGIKLRKTVAGNTIGIKTSQVNLKITKEGKEKFAEEKKEGEEAAKEEKPAETKKEKQEEPKEESKKEEKPADIKESRA
ncbi:MAG: S6e family ribosomal protein [Candidatus Woesearchaeota archaeon]|nr:S6e family ribosomal protein [Candidatus Woesearchaeota archaeon]